ncbi:MAG TPA: thioredoxin [Candidatus Bathyarchaeota archaeon]|nr:thioredoxin [Candidatus Bathyarchaeota archaeon]
MSSDPVRHLDARAFDELIITSDKPVVVDFWAEWCPPCHIMEPIFRDVAEELSGQAIFAKVNVDEAPELAERYRIMAIPTIVIFVNGAPVDRVVGTIGKEALVEFVRRHVRSS